MAVTTKILKLALCLTGCGLLSAGLGCTTIAPDGTAKRYSFGFTIVALPKSAPSRQDFQVSDITTYGVSVGLSGAALGYSKVRSASLPPEGALYFEVRTEDDFQRIRQLITQYPNKDICVSQINQR